MQIPSESSDVNPYLRIAENLDVFHPGEIQILKGVLDDYQQSRDGYIILDEKEETRIIGFVIFGRIPLTMYGWDIYWLAVNKSNQGRGIGKKLISRVEEYITRQDRIANLRVETSTRKEYAHARNLYLKAGFQEVGRIADFYDKNDDIVVFCKRLELAIPESPDKTSIGPESIITPSA